MQQLIELNAANIETAPCCGVKNPAHAGRRRKNCWCVENFDKGLRAQVLVTPDKRQSGYIEYVPGERAWRGVDAKGYLFIHCVWTFWKQYQRQGLGRAMIETCVDEARAQGKHGVAVLAREGPWLAKPALFLKNGFEVVDTAPPDYRLLALKFDPAAPDPSIKRPSEGRLKKFGRGLTIIRADQCPHVAKFADDIAACAREEFGLTPRIVELKSYREAQSAPTPYAIFAVIYEGRLLADHQISRTRFRNIMRKLF